MRRLVLILSAVFAATLLVSFAAIAEPDDQQYERSDGSEAISDSREGTAPDDGASGTDFVSQGSTSGNTPEARAARRDLAVEERLPAYRQVVDNSMKRRFRAPGWTRASDGGSHGKDHALARAGSRARKATFRVRIPTTNDYAIYAWWSAARTNATNARFKISTASGPRMEKVDQTREGGMWIKLGAFEMKKGERTVKVLPSGNADVVADAVVVIRGEQSMPPEQTPTAESGDMMRATATRSATGADIVRVARRYIGTRYRWGECTRYLMSCTCETRRAVAPFGHTFPMTELGQWRYQPSVRVARSNLRPGDIVFYTEPYGPSGLDHVGVYSGRGRIVHSSAYFGKVVESQMKYLKGYYGAIRVRPR
jgi:cell wall-associated NlpC family hydrolase